MKNTKLSESAKIDEPLEKDIGGNIRALTRTSGAFHRPENATGEMSRDGLGTLLRRVSEASTRGSAECPKLKV